MLDKFIVHLRIESNVSRAQRNSNMSKKMKNATCMLSFGGHAVP